MLFWPEMYVPFYQLQQLQCMYYRLKVVLHFHYHVGVDLQVPPHHGFSGDYHESHQ